jgi:UDP-N-acetyl-2-amino-2-deoxyglucuronate dehydrogenase
VSVSKLGVGIAGLGLISRSHVMGYKRLGDLAEIRGVCDVDATKAKAYAAEFGGTAYTNLDELIRDPSIDAIDLILPHRLHFGAAMAVLDAGKHLLIEKPLAATYRESVEICRKADEAGLRFMVAENTRYVTAYVAAERLLREGTIGSVNHVRTYLSSNEKTRLSTPGFWGRAYASGGGLILDTGAHSFYLLKWLLGDFAEVSASATQVFPLNAEVEDTVEVMGTLASKAHFIGGFTAVSEIPHSERLELYGTEGGIIVDQMADPVVKLFRGHRDFAGTAIEGVPPGPDGWHPGGWHYESVLEEVSDFVRAIVQGRAPMIDPYDCAYAIGVVEAAYESIRVKAPVPVP